MHNPVVECTAWFCLLFLKPDGQGVHTQNVLILNVLGQGEYHADANVLCDIFGIHDLLALGGIEGNAVIFDPQYQTLIFVGDPKVGGMALTILPGAVGNDIAGHFLHHQGGEITSAIIDALLLTETLDLPGNTDHFFHASYGDIQPILRTDTELLRDHHKLCHGLRNSMDPTIASSTWIGSSRKHRPWIILKSEENSFMGVHAPDYGCFVMLLYQRFPAESIL